MVLQKGPWQILFHHRPVPFYFFLKPEAFRAFIWGTLTFYKNLRKNQVASHIHVEAPQKLVFENKMF